MKIKYSFSILIIFISNVYCLAFDNKVTHIDITKSAINNSSLDGYLTSVLGLPIGIKTKYNGIEISSILQIGSDVEDVPSCRAANHFHNPLKPWDQSQSTDVWPQDVICQALGWTPRYSNITWATGLKSPDDTPNPRNRQNMGYDNARNYFYNALTSADAPTREALFAKSFQAVGQTLHLLQDMAVPAHVRNDFLSHLIFSSINSVNPIDWFLNPFETYVKKNPSLISSSSQIPTPNITGAIVSDFWDTEGRAGAPFSPGLAEFTNAVYLSDFTIPGNIHIPFLQTHTFPEPQIPTYTCSDNTPGYNKKRKYASRQPCPTNGNPVDHFAAISMFSPRLLGLPPIPLMYFNKYVLDDNVHKTYAGELLPLAVGYSSALLDYFFRGTIELTLPTPTSESYRYIRLKAKNITTTGEEITNPEEIKLVVRYKQVLLDSSQGKIGPEPVPPGEDGYHYLVVPLTNSITTIPKDTPVDLEFDLSDTPLPLWSYDVTLQVVYKGKLGNETGAVAVGRIVLPSIHGDIELALPDKGIYGITTFGLLPPSNVFNEIRVKATNVAAGTDALSDGGIELFVQYKLADADPFNNQPTGKRPLDPENYYIRVPEINGVTTIPRGTAKELVFSLSQKPLPVLATDVHIYVVYTGQIGTKTNQVAIGYRDIAEATPIDLVNNMDYVCVNGSYLPAGSQAAINAVGTEGSGRPIWDIYPHRLKDVYLAFTSTPASSTNYSAKIPVIQPGEYGRVFVLTDYSFNVSSSETVENIANALYDVWGLAFATEVYPLDGVMNQLVYENGNYIDYYPEMYTERGLISWWYTHYENPGWPAGTTCDRSGAPNISGVLTVEIP